MILVNETIRPTISEQPYSRKGVTTINSGIQTPDKCTWYCHQNTSYCKKHHVEWLRPFFKIIDPIYFGIISGLASTGDYALANIVFLVVLWPLLMFYLLVRVWDMQVEINKNKK